MRTNHVMVPDNRGRIFCKKLEKIIVFNDKHFADNCMKCKYFDGLGAGIGAVECKYDDGSNSVSVTVEKPEQLVINYGKAVLKRKLK